MPSIDENTLKQHIKADALQPVYLLWGTQGYLKKHYSHMLIQRAVGGEDDTFNIQRFHAQDVTVDTIAEAAEMLPVMRERKCVLVRDPDIEKLPAADIKKWEQLLSGPPPTCVLILRMDTIEINLKKSAAWRRFFKLVDTVGCTVELTAGSRASLAKLVVSAAAKRGCSLRFADADLIIESCDGDLQTIHSELEKICAFAGEGEITRAHIDAVLVPTPEAGVFDLARALTRGERDRAFRLLDALLYDRAEPVAIVAALSSVYVDLYRARVAADAGVAAESLSADFDYKGKEFRLRNAKRDAARADMKRFAACVELLFETDRKLKSSRADRRVLLEQMVAELLIP